MKTVKYIVWHRNGIKQNDKEGGFFKSKNNYRSDNYCDSIEDAYKFETLDQALTYRTGLTQKNYNYVLDLEKIIEKQLSRAKKFKKILNDKVSIYDYVKFKIFIDKDKNEITKIYKQIIDGPNIKITPANDEIFVFIKNIIKKREIIKPTFVKTNTDIIINNSEDDFWN